MGKSLGDYCKIKLECIVLNVNKIRFMRVFWNN